MFDPLSPNNHSESSLGSVPRTKEKLDKEGFNCLIPSLSQSIKAPDIARTNGPVNDEKIYTGLIINSKGKKFYTDEWFIFSNNEYYASNAGDEIETYLIKNCIENNKNIWYHYPPQKLTDGISPD